MENCYHWNSKCGAYTENANFVTAALEFFGFIWEPSSTDEVNLDRLQDRLSQSITRAIISNISHLTLLGTMSADVIGLKVVAEDIFGRQCLTIKRSPRHRKMRALQQR